MAALDPKDIPKILAGKNSELHNMIFLARFKGLIDDIYEYSK